MITIYKNCLNGLEELQEPQEGCWVNVVDPMPTEIKQLENLGIPYDYLTYPLDLDERARVERENGELLIVLRIPFYQGKSADIPYSTLPLGIIFANDYLVTVCRAENEVIQSFSDGRVRNLSTAKRQRFVLRLLLATAGRYLIYLREINKQVELLEDELQLSTRNREVLELLKHQKSLTYFTTALKSNELMMERLQRSGLFRTYPEDEDLLEDVLTENRQAIEMTNIASNILSSMMDAFASIISNNLNAVMKFLASITIVLSVPTMVASFFGMNTHLPFEDLPSAFFLILGFSALISLSVVFLFWKRDWF
ncbi:MAG TPA: magnesium transporter CorA family protein [Anaerolineales bacterium]|nr:magnesium transporter CorA family protein [Anaerolineales bacterium]